MNAYPATQTSANNWPSPSFIHQSREGRDALIKFEYQMPQFQANNEAILAEVRKNFVVPRDASVTAFLNEHKNLPEILLAAVPELRAKFGTDMIVNLRVPIDESGSQTLYAAIMWPGRLQDVHRALQRFDDEWWLRRAASAYGRLIFTYELV